LMSRDTLLEHGLEDHYVIISFIRRMGGMMSMNDLGRMRRDVL
jgi:hypothetical protein